MIVDTMTIEEVGNAIFKAAKNNKDRVLGLIDANERKKYKKLILTGGERRYDFLPLLMKIDGIRFLVFPFSIGKNDYKKSGIHYCLVAHFYYQGTNWYAKIGNNESFLELFRQHFFQRYIERHLEDDSVVSIDTVRRFLKETDYYTDCNFVTHEKYNNCAFGATKAGLCCGNYINRHIIVWRTFIDGQTIEQGVKRKVLDEFEKIRPYIKSNMKMPIQSSYYNIFKL